MASSKTFRGTCALAAFCLLLVSCEAGPDALVRDSPYDVESSSFTPGLSAHAVHDHLEWVRIEWDEGLPFNEGFVIERSFNGADFVEIARLDGTARSHRDSTETAGSFQYRVTRQVMGGRSVQATTNPVSLGMWFDVGERNHSGGSEEYAVRLPDGRYLVFKPTRAYFGSAAAEILDATTLTWTSIEPAPLTAISSVTPLEDGRILVLGLDGDAHNYRWDQMSIVIFDMINLEWNRLPAVPHPPADTYRPFILAHMGGDDVLISFQAIDSSPIGITRVVQIAYVVDVGTGEFREIEAPNLGGERTYARIRGSAPVLSDRIRVFGSLERHWADDDWGVDEGCMWTFEIQRETWSMKCSWDQYILPHLLPLGDSHFLELGEYGRHIYTDGATIRRTTSFPGRGSARLFIDDGYVVGGPDILTIQHSPLRHRAYPNPFPWSASTSIPLDSGRYLATSSATRMVLVSRVIEELRESTP
jgi:hypothetical protein